MDLETDLVFLRVTPGSGARVTSLIDKRTGRDWIVQGDGEGDASDDASFLDSASGWDECFPTVGTSCSEEWGGDLRDHGLLWARPWTVTRSANGLVAQFSTSKFTFRRAFRLLGNTLFVRYSLQSHHPAPLPWLWSQHCLLTPRIGETFTATGLSEWRDSDAQKVVPGPAGPHGAPQVEKLFAKVLDTTPNRAEVALTGPEGTLRFCWRGRDLPYAGLWYCYGAWPADNPLYQVAIEPTTHPFSKLDEALAQGRAHWIAPGQTAHWSLCLRLD
jgi:hypothetical protein